MFHTDLTPFGVNMERLTKQRLERLQQAMKQQGLGALMLTDHQNIRYATNSVFARSSCNGDPALRAGARERCSVNLSERNSTKARGRHASERTCSLCARR